MNTKTDHSVIKNSSLTNETRSGVHVRHRIRNALCVLLAAVLILTTGCSGQEKESKESLPVSIGLTDDLVSLDPAVTKDTVSETIARCTFSTLYTFDENMELVPCLAEKSQQVSDLEWTFTIRNNAYFHDGTPLTASDVKYSVQRAKAMEGGDSSLSIIDKVEAPDPYTLQVTTTEPFVNLPSVFVRVSTSVMSEKAMAKDTYSIDQPIGSGPFQFVSRSPGKSVELKRFDQYFLKPAKTEYLNFLIQPSEQERTANLLTGELDVVFRISPYDCDNLKLNDDVKIYQTDSTKMELMQFNPDYAPLNDIRVRQAIAHAINRQTLVDNVLNGYGSPLNSLLPPPLAGAIGDADFSYNPELSKQLLKEAGYADGLELTALTFDMMRKNMMEYIRLDLAQVGIQLNYEFYELSDYLDIIKKNQHQATLMSWTSNADPDSTFSQLYSKNSSPTVNQCHYSDQQVEVLMTQGKMEQDPEKRRTIYEEANRIVSSSYFYLPLYQPMILVAAGTDIGGVRINAQGIFSYESLYRK